MDHSMHTASAAHAHRHAHTRQCFHGACQLAEGSRRSESWWPRYSPRAPHGQDPHGAFCMLAHTMSFRKLSKVMSSSGSVLPICPSRCSSCCAHTRHTQQGAGPAVDNNMRCSTHLVLACLVRCLERVLDLAHFDRGAVVLPADSIEALAAGRLDQLHGKILCKAQRANSEAGWGLWGDGAACHRGPSTCGGGCLPSSPHHRRPLRPYHPGCSSSQCRARAGGPMRRTECCKFLMNFCSCPRKLKTTAQLKPSPC